MNETVQRNRDLVTRYKRDIDLVAYLEQDGFALVKHKSTRRWPVLKHPLTDRKLIVGRSEKSGDYFYLNPDDSRDRGSIIDYAAGQLRLDLDNQSDWRDLHTHLSRYVGVWLPRHEPALPPPADPVARAATEARYFKLDPFSQTDYLQNERSLTPETCRHPAFAGKIFNKTLRDQATGETMVNTCFPIENERGMIGIIVRNSAFNKIFGVKEDGLWRSALPPGHQPKELLLTESPIDCLSYHQLYPPREPFDRLYVATAGHPSTGQFGAVQALIDRLKPGTVVLGNDNEPSGIRYNINWLGRLRLPGQAEPVIHATIGNHRTTNTLTVEVLAAGQSLPALAERIDAVLNRGFAADARPATVSERVRPDGTAQLRVVFQTGRALLIRAEKLVAALRGLDSQVVVKRPTEKDWNEDVKAGLAQQARKQGPDQTLPVSPPTITQPGRCTGGTAFRATARPKMR